MLRSLSIIIANYNHGRYVGDAINSALKQTWMNKEVIVVDDGSGDDSRQVIERYGDQILPIFKPNGGQASAFNVGFMRSKSDVIIFLDSDDMLLSNAAEQAITRFDSPAVSHVHWRLRKVNAQGQPTGEIVPREKLPVGDISNQVIRDGPGTWIVSPTSGNAWSRAFLDQVMPMPESEFRHAADSYLFTLSPIFGELRAIDEPNSLYRIHGSNYTLGSGMKMLTEARERYEYRANVLAKILQRGGLDSDIDRWRRVAWWPRLDAALNDIASVVPEGQSVVLIDEDQWGLAGDLRGRRGVPLVERDGTYWGPPESDGQAIAEIDRQKGRSTKYVVVAWTALWWLDHYVGMKRYLESNGQRVLDTERVVIFKLSD
jgi:glycosyltransferase involved in cell wall biosynthesis